MALFQWLVEAVGGALFLWWAMPGVLAFARAVRQTKWTTATPRYDFSEYAFWLGGGAGVILAACLAVLLPTFNLVNFVLVATLFGGVAVYLAEWLSQQVLPEKHPWRAVVENMTTQIGVEPGEIRYRLCSQRVPYNGFFLTIELFPTRS